MSNDDGTRQEARGAREAGISGPRLAPRPVRLAVFALLLVIAVLAIRYIDARAMLTMDRMEREAQRAANS